MYLEAKETAELYKLLTDKLGGDTTEAMFKYIDNKTERAVEATIKTLATKDDLFKVKEDVTKEMANMKYELGKDISESKSELTRWMFVFWVGQLAAMIAFLYLKK